MLKYFINLFIYHLFILSTVISCNIFSIDEFVIIYLIKSFFIFVIKLYDSIMIIMFVMINFAFLIVYLFIFEN
jgi:hypothetical protein